MSLWNRWWRGGGSAAGKHKPAGDPERVRQVEELLHDLRPMFRLDGGDVDLVGVEEGWVQVRFRGACTHCSQQSRTLEDALEPRLRAALPWFAGLRAV